MIDMNPYETQSNLQFEATRNALPINFVFSGMVAVVTALLMGFLLYAGFTSGFKWPGAIKSSIALTILLVCLAYGTVRGGKELKQLRELSSSERQIGVLHILLVFAFCLAIQGFVHWVSKSTTF